MNGVKAKLSCLAGTECQRVKMGLRQSFKIPQGIVELLFEEVATRGRHQRSPEVAFRATAGKALSPRLLSLELAATRSSCLEDLSVLAVV